jgi:asparagine synthase (glutamine-hydrolysing)
MCGFAVCFDPDGRTPDTETLRAAADVLAHRGPDDVGFLSEPGLGFAFRRLSIVDVSSGHQPLSNEDGTIWIVYNGEIYNHRDLRSELEALGHRYRTQSDSETIVHAYEQWGDACVERLRGMFVFAIWDRRSRRLFVGRDRVGIKPLYHARVGSTFVCASEVKALFAFPGVPRTVHLPALVEHLTLRYTPAPATLFAGIEKLPPGHVMHVDARGVGPAKRYWSVTYEPKIAISDDEALTELERRLTESVRLRLMSEVPLGALLSGGVDSSVVVALMSRLLARPVQTFSVGFDEEGYSELPYARQVADHLGTEHREIVVGPGDLANLLPHLAWHQDEPVSEPAAIPTFLVSRLARETVTVVLTGEGGDELFAGYPKYAAEPVARTLAALPKVVRERWLGDGVDRLPFGFRKLQVVARSARFRDEAERLAAWFAGFAGDERKRLLSDRLALHDHAAASAFRETLDRSTAKRPLDRMLDVDLQLWLADDLLMKMDKMSMAASIEARVPLLDHPLVEWAARLPDRHKVNGARGKVLLKRLARTLLPRGVVDRPKVGFTVPLSPWFRGPLRELLQDTLLGPTALSRGYYHEATLRRYVEDHLAGRKDRARELWTLLTLELWHRAFIDRPPVRDVPYVAPPRTQSPIVEGRAPTVAFGARA